MFKNLQEKQGKLIVILLKLPWGKEIFGILQKFIIKDEK